MMNFFKWLLGAIFLAFLIFVVLLIEQKEHISSGWKEYKYLLRRKQKLLMLLKIKQKLKRDLERAYKKYYFASCFLAVGSMFSTSYLVNLYFLQDVSLEKYLYSFAMVNIIIGSCSFLYTQEFRGFKKLLEKISPVLKQKIYGRRSNIAQQIQDHKNEVSRITWRVSELEQIFA